MRPWLPIALWTARKARRAAVARLRPFVDRLAARGLGPQDGWLDGYGLGLLSTLVTLAAQRAVDRLDPEALGLVQSEAWGALTGLESHTVGARIATLSLEGDAAFVAGCRAAMTFDDALGPDAAIGDDDEALRRRAALFELWDRVCRGDAG